MSKYDDRPNDAGEIHRSIKKMMNNARGRQQHDIYRDVRGL